MAVELLKVLQCSLVQDSASSTLLTFKLVRNKNRAEGLVNFITRVTLRVERLNLIGRGKTSHNVMTGHRHYFKYSFIQEKNNILFHTPKIQYPSDTAVTTCTMHA